MKPPIAPFIFLAFLCGRVIQHPTLVARDAYAARGGWFGERAITAITYHKSFGEVGTVTVTPEMLEAA